MKKKRLKNYPFKCFSNTAAEVALQLNCSEQNIVVTTRRAIERIAREVLFRETGTTPSPEHLEILVQDTGFQDCVEYLIRSRANMQNIRAVSEV